MASFPVRDAGGTGATIVEMTGGLATNQMPAQATIWIGPDGDRSGRPGGGNPAADKTNRSFRGRLAIIICVGTRDFTFY